ncbi:transcription termination/antitermination protein NusG [Lacisediminihabitans changchengi]|uniref:Transcription termination/antitermination protein NusG n=1 Tax=Lacisediminihabitans changchengi TaxID=2787634 RepID=A0A934SUA3_9MICO|nr:transcription termination/antitermination protein NusG [Lacisediminihabitans changchengi]MBK4349088.1 transcription termination/antitermination protein NusG [Lacisediminihabitans changchengi]
MAGTERDDIDLSTAAEQSSEEDEAQEGSYLAADEASIDSAETEALHIVDQDGVDDLDDEAVDLSAAMDAIEAATDPEADAIIADALDIDSADEAEASVEAVDGEAESDDDGEPPVVVPFDEQFESEIESELAEQASIDESGIDEEAEVDPYEEFRKELKYALGKWYVIHSYAGFEKRVKQNIENRKVSMTMEDYIFQVEVPMEDVVEIKNGQRKLVNRVRIPGYVLVRMDLNEDSWSVVRHTPGVTGFVGNSHNPTPLRFEEAFNMLKSLVQIVEAPAKTGAKGGKVTQRSIPQEVDFEIGETITIKEGSFAGLPGSISEIKPESGKLTVLVSLFERETPVELSFEQVTKL